MTGGWVRSARLALLEQDQRECRAAEQQQTRKEEHMALIRGPDHAAGHLVGLLSAVGVVRAAGLRNRAGVVIGAGICAAAGTAGITIIAVVAGITVIAGIAVIPLVVVALIGVGNGQVSVSSG